MTIARMEKEIELSEQKTFDLEKPDYHFFLDDPKPNHNLGFKVEKNLKDYYNREKRMR